mmetsp:Transcript_10805/g.25048  ORF Transcript_10805/g.25048 Transcript_10805/m.25048 type:complete len:139 (+) Transcript_10805:449-865(+)
MCKCKEKTETNRKRPSSLRKGRVSWHNNNTRGATKPQMTNIRQYNKAKMDRASYSDHPFLCLVCAQYVKIIHLSKHPTISPLVKTPSSSIVIPKQHQPTVGIKVLVREQDLSLQHFLNDSRHLLSSIWARAPIPRINQ